MKKSYKHLSPYQRSQIDALYVKGHLQKDIAEVVGVDESSISRELNRNRKNGKYDYIEAQKMSMERRSKASKREKKWSQFIETYVIEELEMHQSSPEQISGSLLKRHGISISFQRIYDFIKENRKKGKKLYLNLRRQGRKKYKKREKLAGKSLIPNRVDISERPKIVDKKIRFGDFEVDTIIGHKQSGILLSVVDRYTKLTRLKKLKSKHSKEVTSSLISIFKELNFPIHTVTFDNGLEFSGHEELKKELGVDTYFAEPYCSWQRGLNEHTNGLVRQYFPKRSRFDIICDEEVMCVENILNERPRKSINFSTPTELLGKLSCEGTAIALRD